MSSHLASMAGWYLLPNLVTGWVQSAFYAVWIRAGESKPQPGSRAFVSHRRKIHILVILAYLCYTIHEADWELRRRGDFYQPLGVSHSVEERGLQSRFRRLTVIHHPDKISSVQDRPAAEAFYVHLKLCRDVLADPVKRFAYDRFGPEILAWRQCKTIQDYVVTGVKNLGMYYAGTGALLFLLGITGLQKNSFWRYLALVSLFVFELSITTKPTFPVLFTKFINPLLAVTTRRAPYLPFQAITLMRKLVLTFFIALSQIGPLLTTPLQTPPDSKQISAQQLDRLASSLGDTDKETSRMLDLELTPFSNDPNTMQDFRASMRRFLVDNTVRANLEVRTAVGRVLERRRPGVPHGAVGAR